MIPDRQACLRVLQEERVPEHIRDHSAKVAHVALTIAGELGAAGEELDLALIEAGALLHDIKKMFTIDHGGNHARLGGERVRELGFAELEEVVARHVDLGEWQPEGAVVEAEVVYYADKRVKHTDIVTLEERFLDLLERYGKTQGARDRITFHHQTVIKLEKKIFSRITLEPDFL